MEDPRLLFTKREIKDGALTVLKLNLKTFGLQQSLELRVVGR